MALLPTLIGVAGSLFGANKAEKSAARTAAQERAWALEDQAEQFVRLRAAAEKGGFNPLSVLGAAPGSGMVGQTSAAGAQNYMGEAIATSSLMLADSLAKTKAAASGRKVEDLNRQRDILTRKLAAATLRPKVPGVFDRPSKFGTGGGNALAAVQNMVRPTYGGTLHSTAVEPVEPKVIAGSETYTSHGQATNVKIGPDPEEYFSGLIIDAVNRGKARAAFENTWEARAGRAQRYPPAPPAAPPAPPSWHANRVDPWWRWWN